MKKLEIGPYTNNDNSVVRLGPDWETLSVVPGDNVDHVAKWGHEDLPIGDDTYDLIHAAHVLEHIDHWRVVEALKETLRILKPGGILEVHVPDIRWLIQQWMSGECDKWQGHHLIKYDLQGKPVRGTWFNARVLGFSESPHWDGTREHYRHRTLFDAEHLEWCMHRAGFVDLKFPGIPRGQETHGAKADGSLALNLGRQGRKP